MRVLLTTLSVLAGWALLVVLVVGLRLILKWLKSVHGSLQRITAGVRAIEQETRPLGDGAETLTTSLGEAARTIGATARHLAGMDRRLDGTPPVLQSHSTGGN